MTSLAEPKLSKLLELDRVDMSEFRELWFLKIQKHILVDFGVLVSISGSKTVHVSQNKL